MITVPLIRIQKQYLRIYNNAYFIYFVRGLLSVENYALLCGLWAKIPVLKNQKRFFAPVALLANFPPIQSCGTLIKICRCVSGQAPDMILDLEPVDEMEDNSSFVQINTDSVSGGPKT